MLRKLKQIPFYATRIQIYRLRNKVGAPSIFLSMYLVQRLRKFPKSQSVADIYEYDFDNVLFTVKADKKQWSISYYSTSDTIVNIEFKSEY